MALAQRDLKRLVAWSSFSHMGFIALGIFSLTEAGITGASFQMVSHGLVTGGLFLATSYLCRGGAGIGTLAAGPAGGRRGTAVLTFFALASLGLPGTASFIGEFLIVAGAFGAGAWAGLVAGVAVAGGAWYMLRLLRRGVYEPHPAPVAGGADLAAGETALLAILAAAILALGIFPGLLTGILHAATAVVLSAVGGG
jgi:NADH-quinone oxidoreductase subunit M